MRDAQGEGETGNRSSGWPGPCTSAAVGMDAVSGLDERSYTYQKHLQEADLMRDILFDDSPAAIPCQ